MAKFANYEPDLHLRPRIWFLHLDMKKKEIQEAGGLQTAADIVHQLMDKAPKEYAIKKSIAKKKSVMQSLMERQETITLKQ